VVSGSCQGPLCFDWALESSVTVSQSGCCNSTSTFLHLKVHASGHVTPGWVGLLFGASDDGMTNGDGLLFTFDDTTGTGTVARVGPAALTLTPPMGTLLPAADVRAARLFDPARSNEKTAAPTEWVARFPLSSVGTAASPPLQYSPRGVAGVRTRVSFAYGHATQFMQHARGATGRVLFDLFGGIVEPQGQVDYLLVYLPALVGFVVSLAVASALFVLPCLRHSALVDALAFRQLAGVRASWLTSRAHRLALDVAATTASLTFIEAAAVALYAGAITVMAAAGPAIHAAAYPGGPLATRLPLDSSHVLGHVLVVHLSVLLLPLTRSSPLLALFRLSYDRAVKFHRFLARATLIFLVAHLAAMVARYGPGGGLLHAPFAATKYGAGVGWGLLSGAAMVLTVTAALEPLRRANYELFAATHGALGLLTIAGAMAHSVFARYCILPALALFLADRLLSMLCLSWSPAALGAIQVARVQSYVLTDGCGWSTGRASASQLTRLTLHFSKPVRIAPGQFMRLAVPMLSGSEVHPFTVAAVGDAAGSALMMAAEAPDAVKPVRVRVGLCPPPAEAARCPRSGWRPRRPGRLCSWRRARRALASARCGPPVPPSSSSIWVPAPSPAVWRSGPARCSGRRRNWRTRTLRCRR
jgi:hypothetical protein